MENGLDVVAIGVEHESRIVSGMISSLAGRTVVAPAMGQRRVMKGIHCRAVLRLESKVVPSCQNAQRRRTFCRRHDKLVSPEISIGGVDNRNLQRSQNGSVEIPAGLDILHHELDVVDKPTSMQLMNFDDLSPCESEPVNFVLNISQVEDR